MLTEDELHRVICDSTGCTATKLVAKSGAPSGTGGPYTALGRKDVEKWRVENHGYGIHRVGGFDWCTRANGGQMALELDSGGNATRVFVSTIFGQLMSVNPDNGTVTALAAFDRYEQHNHANSQGTYNPGLALQSYLIPGKSGPDSKQVRLYMTSSRKLNTGGLLGYAPTVVDIWRINVNKLDELKHTKGSLRTGCVNIAVAKCANANDTQRPLAADDRIPDRATRPYQEEYAMSRAFRIKILVTRLHAATRTDMARRRRAVWLFCRHAEICHRSYYSNYT